MKKLILTFLLISTSLFATNALNLNYDAEYKEISIYPNDDLPNIDAGEQDWVALYKSGDSNDWDNVILWKWVNELDSYKFAGENLEKEAKTFDVTGVDNGNYELRYFLNNSYDTYSSLNFQIGGNGGGDDKLTILSHDNSSITVNVTYVGDDSWLGIYEKGKLNDWDNVQAWTFIDSNEETLDISNLPSGEYDIRLFYNNSYNTQSNKLFTKDGDGGVEPKISIISQTDEKLTLSTTHKGDDTWVGIFPKGAKNLWENVQAWSWVTGDTTTINIEEFNPSKNHVGLHEARLFYNNSYNVEDVVAVVTNLDKPKDRLSDEDIENLIKEDIINRYENYNDINGVNSKRDTKIIHINYDENENAQIITQNTLYFYDNHEYNHYREQTFAYTLSYYTLDKNHNLEFKTDIYHNHRRSGRQKKLVIQIHKKDNFDYINESNYMIQIKDGKKSGFYLFDPLHIDSYTYSNNDNASHNLKFLGITDKDSLSGLFFSPKVINEVAYAHITRMDNFWEIQEEDIEVQKEFLTVYSYNSLQGVVVTQKDLKYLDNSKKELGYATKAYNSVERMLVFDITNPQSLKLTTEVYAPKNYGLFEKYLTEEEKVIYKKIK